MSNPTQESLDALHVSLVSSLKSLRFNDAIPILSELRDQMSQIITNSALYSHWLRVWMPTVKDILMDVNAVKKKAKDTKSKDGKDVKSPKEKEKKPHPFFVSPKHSGVRRCLLEILSKCPLNEVFHGHASTALSCCVNVLLVDYEGKCRSKMASFSRLLLVWLIFVHATMTQLIKNATVVTLWL